MMRARLSDWMTPDPVTLSPETEITRATATLVAHAISSAPVVDAAGKLVGILSSRDCFRAALHAHYHEELGHTVAHYMSREVRTLDADLDIISAAEIFLETTHRQFPVTADGRLVGIVSRRDLLRAFQHHGAA